MIDEKLLKELKFLKEKTGNFSNKELYDLKLLKENREKLELMFNNKFILDLVYKNKNIVNFENISSMQYSQLKMLKNIFQNNFSNDCELLEKLSKTTKTGDDIDDKKVIELENVLDKILCSDEVSSIIKSKSFILPDFIIDENYKFDKKHLNNVLKKIWLFLEIIISLSIFFNFELKLYGLPEIMKISENFLKIYKMKK
ncbi:MAG: hypothetical protein ACRC6K_04480 [Fusobacteriaceae bacterium]